MKSTLLFLVCILHWLTAYEQNMDVLQADKLKLELANAGDDTSRAFILTQLAEAYRDRVTDSSFTYAQNALELSRQIGYPRGESKALLALSYYFFNRGNLTQGLELGLKALAIIKKYNLRTDQPYAMVRIGNVYMSLKDYQEALRYFHQARDLSENSQDTFIYAVAFWRAADAYNNLNRTDSALFSGKKAEEIAKAFGNQFVQNGVSYILGNVYAKKGNDELALQYYRKSTGGLSYVNLAAFFRDRGLTDSAIYYGKLAYESSVRNSVRQLELNAAILLSSLYESTAPQEALRYLKIAMNAKDSLYGAEKVVAVTSVAFKEKERENELRVEQMAYRSKVKLYALLAGLALVVIIALLLFRNIRNEKKANTLLTKQKNELASTLSDLKKTQAQLIQSAKMASLGELTAGIAHEIQNPLNFVNNFADVNTELVEEASQEIDGGQVAAAKMILNDIKENSAKISHHGKRADAIVKGMLQHTRSSSATREPTDINKLADEYLRLAYHGLRAKDKSFNATIKTDFDETIGKVNIVPQDIGRVILNLINNAFYACTERRTLSEAEVSRSAVSEREKLTANSQQLTASSYEPTVTIATKRMSLPAGGPEGGQPGYIEIRVADNGPGIPQKILDKIFQPFFTTKPTGQGTGLGLSLSYDIVKAHGGEIKVDTKENEGTTFTIKLPIQQL